MRDVSGNKLSVGDRVVTVFDGYAHLEVARVIGFTPVKIRVERATGSAYTKYPNQVSKVVIHPAF